MLIGIICKIIGILIGNYLLKGRDSKFLTVIFWLFLNVSSYLITEWWSTECFNSPIGTFLMAMDFMLIRSFVNDETAGISIVCSAIVLLFIAFTREGGLCDTGDFFKFVLNI